MRNLAYRKVAPFVGSLLETTENCTVQHKPKLTVLCVCVCEFVYAVVKLLVLSLILCFQL